MFLMMVLVGTIAGAGLAIVRLFISWCTCGGDDKNTDSDRSFPEIRRDDYVVNSDGPLDSWLVPPTEMEDYAGGKHHADENHRPGDMKDLVGNGVLNANQYLMPDEPPGSHLREQREKAIDSKPRSNDRGIPNDSACNRRGAFQEEADGQDELIFTGEPTEDTANRVPVTGGLDDAVHRIFPVSKLTTPGMPVSFLISSTMPQGLPVNPHTDTPRDGQLEGTTGSLMFETPEIKNFRGSEKCVFDSPKFLSTKKPPTKTSRVRFHEQNKKKEDATKLPAPIHKAGSTGVFEMQIPALDVGRNSQSLSNAPQTIFPAPEAFKRISDELTKKNVLPPCFDFRPAKDPLVSLLDGPGGEKNILKSANFSRPLGFTPYTSLSNPRQPRVTFAPEIVVTAAGDRKADKGGGQSDTSNQILFDRVSLNLNPRQVPARASLGHEATGLVKVEKVTGFISGKQPPKGSFLASVTALGSLEFTPDLSNSDPFRKTCSIEVAQSSAKDVGTRIPGPNGLREDLPSVLRTRQISIPRLRKINIPPETKSLNFTVGRKFRHPSHFPQLPPVFWGARGNQPKTTKIFESATEEPEDVLNGEKRVLQDGSLKMPLVGRVKLVSKIVGKDPGFTYTTWAKAGSKRSRGVHNCQQEGGCRVCD